MELTLILGILKEGLKLLNTPEGVKAFRRIDELEKEYWDELKKPYDDRSQLYLDERLLEINSIGKNFLKYASAKQ